MDFKPNKNYIEKWEISANNESEIISFIKNRKIELFFEREKLKPQIINKKSLKKGKDEYLVVVNIPINKQVKKENIEQKITLFLEKRELIRNILSERCKILVENNTYKNCFIPDIIKTSRGWAFYAETLKKIYKLLEKEKIEDFIKYNLVLAIFNYGLFDDKEYLDTFISHITEVVYFEENNKYFLYKKINEKSITIKVLKELKSREMHTLKECITCLQEERKRLKLKTKLERDLMIKVQKDEGKTYKEISNDEKLKKLCIEKKIHKPFYDEMGNILKRMK